MIVNCDISGREMCRLDGGVAPGGERAVLRHRRVALGGRPLAANGAQVPQKVRYAPKSSGAVVA